MAIRWAVRFCQAVRPGLVRIFSTPLRLVNIGPRRANGQIFFPRFAKAGGGPVE
jgi:hypothetical protein